MHKHNLIFPISNAVKCPKKIYALGPSQSLSAAQHTTAWPAFASHLCIRPYTYPFHLDILFDSIPFAEFQFIRAKIKTRKNVQSENNSL